MAGCWWCCVRSLTAVFWQRGGMLMGAPATANSTEGQQSSQPSVFIWDTIWAFVCLQERTSAGWRQCISISFTRMFFSFISVYVVGVVSLSRVITVQRYACLENEGGMVVQTEIQHRKEDGSFAAIPSRSNRQGGNLCRHSGWGRRKGRAPHHSRGSCGPETALPADTGSDSRLCSHSHQPVVVRINEKTHQYNTMTTDQGCIFKLLFRELWDKAKVNGVEVSVTQWSQPCLKSPRRERNKEL